MSDVAALIRATLRARPPDAKPRPDNPYLRPRPGREQPPDAREKIRRSRLGKRHSPETRAKIRATAIANAAQETRPQHPCKGMTRMQRHAFDRIAEPAGQPAPRRPTIEALLAAGMIERGPDGAMTIPTQKLMAWRVWAAWCKTARLR